MASLVLKVALVLAGLGIAIGLPLSIGALRILMGKIGANDAPVPIIEIHPSDAIDLGVGDGDAVRDLGRLDAQTDDVLLEISAHHLDFG